MSIIASKGFVLACTFATFATFAGLIVVVVLHFAPRGPTPGTTYALGGTGGARATGTPGTARPFTMGGNATEPISPGVRAPLDVRLTNPHDFPMSVTNLRVSVQKVSAPHADNTPPCAAGDFTVDQAQSGRKITVAARSTNTLSSLGLARATWPQVGMLNRSANQDACKGASLTLAYTASGTAEQ